jgi:hypothetical protein
VITPVLKKLVRCFFPARPTAYEGEPLNPRAQIALGEGTLPPPMLMYLVAGTADANWFIDSGRLAVESIEEALRRQGTSLDDFSSVLDFACGAGRVIRHLSSRSNLALAGCDYNPQLVSGASATYHLRISRSIRRPQTCHTPTRSLT